MKYLFFSFAIFFLLFSSCIQEKEVQLTFSNPLNISRSKEVVHFNFDNIAELIGEFINSIV